MNPCKIVQTTATHQMCETCHAKWHVDSESRQAPCPFPAFARVVLDKIVAEAEELGRAAGRAEERADIVAWLRERVSDFGPNYVTGYEPSATIALEQVADDLEARAKAPVERQDGGERA